MTVPRPLASGRTADVFALDGHRVLRRYRDGGDVADEAAVMTYLGGLGFPVPRVYLAQRTDLVLQRLDGATLLEALRGGQIGVAAAGEMLAGLHTRLHALPPRLSRDPAARILHLDLHPENVMLTAAGPVVIDWRNASEGPPDLDVAFTALIIAQVAVGLDVGVPRSAARELLRPFWLTPAAIRSACSTSLWHFGPPTPT